MFKRSKKKRGKNVSAAAADTTEKLKQAIVDEAESVGKVAERAEHSVEQYVDSHRRPLRTIALSSLAFAALVGIALAIQRSRS